ncbi:dorsal-ventral patterning protein Sog [Odontomachus brunneus]|uniref:dorsal-ventral patterning protein Sog n=1 Tax=Odontomachus brunneus TaxID=486640 RepID=UPI0013F228B6|nr:dorsal-ventral patterning protein Sog [Odontomachus brunneus]XP_032668083.1 dorsal-ventral patterning protein Sog [Odontomachus brunneus]XP_032668084.1 dorsal-ventral patterning protein Sog [Odontomachus brunneus]XP_032668085.1 dorsal-ventral patterning protein Sog [Odontomachus brunneus]XP_032668086.1 dorsal-ventral patterning protein Sog [Odontomachus brunneus]XP_032668087.1 dorsal-ventral patterning protein Sog [Odontomachus brunneus]
MQFLSGLILPILLNFALCLLLNVLTLYARQVAPLIEDDWARRPHRAAECNFGKQIRELGTTWFADLGPPFGVMYCIKCECVPVQKKKRIVARVQCRNIKNECSQLTCDEPVLLPGRCCKSCPGDFSTDIVQDLPVQLSSEEEERNLKHFGTLLTGRTSQSVRCDDPNPTSVYNSAYNYLATGRFTFHRKNLYYSFYLSASTPRPRSIQFVDGSGSILEEQAIDPVGGVYQNVTGKLCGVWRRVPRDYRKLLREERLHVSFLWEPSASLTGQLSRYRALSTEQYSSLLEPTMGVDRSLMSGAGATAIVSASSISAPSIHVSLVFNGLFLPNDVAEVPLIVQLEHQEKDYVVLREEMVVKKPSNELNFGEVRSALSGADLRLLTRGKLSISIMSRKDPQALRLVGTVGPRATCDMYQTLLLSETPSVASGLAWAYLDRIGALRYGVQLIGLEEESPLVTLVDEGGKRRMELEDLTPSLVGGFANGSLDRPGPRLLEPLFKGELSVVAASHLGSMLRGRLLERPVADARDTAAPVLLRRLNREPTHSGPVGLIWTAVDLDCSLHYELELAGFSSSSQEPRTFRLYLETMPRLAQGAPVARRLLEEFTGYSLEGSVTGLSSMELYRIESGIGFLEVTEKQAGHILKAPFKARAPFSCLPHYADNDVASVVAYNLQPSKSDFETGACFHETRFYEEGTQWTSNTDSCSMCHCHRGLPQCDSVPCPALSCTSGKQVKQSVAGHCCSICVAITVANNTTVKSNTMKGCTLAGQYHLAGSSWHPYLPPVGFDTCAVCTCDAVTLEVKCPRVQCPPLECDEKLAVRPEKKACCRQCPATTPRNVAAAINDTARLPRDQALPSTRRTAEEILASGGCKYPVGGPYENGMEWHPRVHSHGEMKCVKCRCKNGEVRCDRKRCPRSLCNSIAHQMKRGEYVADVDDCCTAQCRRARRHHRNNHHPASRHSVTPRELS